MTEGDMTAGDIRGVLVVCSANQCRSPLAAAVLADRLARLGLATEVSSAGTHAFEGVPATDSTRLAATRLGLDLTAHRSRPATPELVRAADLVLTMERHHLREVVVLEPAAFTRSFTLKELVRRGDGFELTTVDEASTSRLARLHRGRRPVDLLGASPDDDVEDPTGSPFADHETMAREVSELVDRTVEVVWGPLPGA
jgi:protein-tyrosine phosphatase